MVISIVCSDNSSIRQRLPGFEMFQKFIIVFQ